MSLVIRALVAVILGFIAGFLVWLLLALLPGAEPREVPFWSGVIVALLYMIYPWVNK